MSLPVVPYCPHFGGPQSRCHYCALEAAARRRLARGDGYLHGYRPHPSRAYVTRLGLAGVGDSETPAVATLPWQIDKPEAVDRWERAATILGVIGGLVGLAATLKLIK